MEKEFLCAPYWLLPNVSILHKTVLLRGLRLNIGTVLLTKPQPLFGLHHFLLMFFFLFWGPVRIPQ